MRKKWFYVVVGAALLVLVPGLVWASGESAGELVVVADTRHLSGFSLFIARLYNENIWLFAVCAVVLTTALGAVLGLLMDFIMSRTGLDLGKTRKVEH
jgi:hypothetical protein